MKNKTLWPFIILITIALGGFWLWQNYENTDLNNSTLIPPENHIWDTYYNDKYNFYLSYPSDIMSPQVYEYDETVYNIVFEDNENNTLVFINIEDSDTNDLLKSTALLDSYVVATTTVAGHEAIQTYMVDPGPIEDDYELNFIKDKKLYSVSFRDNIIEPESINYMINSFKFNKWNIFNN